MIKKVYTIAATILIFLISVSWTRPYTIFPNEQKDWVDSVYNSMTLEEKLGQLFMVAAYSNKGASHEQEILNLVQNYHIGGLIFFQGGPGRQIRQTNLYQSSSKIPLLIAMDAEWGLNMRLDSTLRFPRQMTLGAIQNDSLIYEMGRSIAEECQALGVHINFAPVVDVNVNPANPVIGTRSFGEQKENVARKGIAYMKGMQDNGVIAVAKHFPGHGDTDKDSHVSLPVIKHNKKRLREIELYPFERLIENGVQGIMVAHLHIPALDRRKNRATTLSEKVVTDLLQKDLGYDELIFTDALNMKGVSEFNKPGVVDELAFMAGNDVLLFPEDVPAAIKRFKRSYKKGDITEERLARSVKKILRAKYRTGLNDFKPISSKNVYKKLVNGKREALIQRLYQEAITLVKNENDLIPLQNQEVKRLATVSIGLDSTFNRMVQKYNKADAYYIKDGITGFQEISELTKKLNNYDLVIIGIGGMNNSRWKNYGISSPVMNMVNTINKKTKTLVSVFGNPYSLKNFEHIPNLICAYKQNRYTSEGVPQVIFGAIPCSGKLPVSANESITAGIGKASGSLNKLGYSIPGAMGLSADTLKLIDTLVKEIIETQASPGCQILIARNGKILLEKGYGHFTYEKLTPVSTNTIYDLASITKVAATLQAVMKLQAEGKIDINAHASNYLPELKGTNKEFVTIKNALLHQAGLVPYLPHWKSTLDSTNGLSEHYYCDINDSWFCRAVSDGLYSTPAVKDSIWKWTIESELRAPIVEDDVDEKKKKRKKRRKKKQQEEEPDYASMKFEYKYSDLGFYILKEVVERITRMPLDEYVQKEFYSKMGLQTLTYNPANEYGIDKVPPTEDDKYFRNKLIQGYVHDQGASMMGGVGGHAGLFSNAFDLAQLMQMNLQNGHYDGKTYFANDTVVRFFSQKQVEENRRGLGWDKPFEDGSREGSTSYLASHQTFGHSGFTGTCTWVDPKYNLIYVFLSNRIYPDAANSKLISNNYRTRIHDIIYRSLGAKEEPHPKVKEDHVVR